MSIYERIKERRKALGLTADDVAEKLGVSRATIYRYESADIEKLPTSSLEPLAKALQTTPAYLMGWTDDPYELPADNTQYRFIPPLTVHEITVMLQYRAKPEMQSAIDTLLGINKDAQPEPDKVVPMAPESGAEETHEKMYPVMTAAYGDDGSLPRIHYVSESALNEAQELTKEIVERMEEAEREREESIARVREEFSKKKKKKFRK